MAKIFDAGGHFFRIDLISYMTKKEDVKLAYHLEGGGVQEYVLECKSTEQRDLIYEYIKNEIINL